MAAEAAKPHFPVGASKLVGPLAIVAYLLSLPVLAFGIWLVSTRDYDCEDLLREPNVRVAVGVGLLLVFVISNFVVYYGDRVLMPGHMVLSVAIVVMLTAGLSLVGTYRIEARGLPGSPLWLFNRVMRVETWNEVKTCLCGDMICEDLAYRTIQFTSRDFNLMKLSALEHTAPQDTWRISDRPLRKRRTTGQPRYFMLSSHMVVQSGWGPSDDAIVQKLRVRCAGNNCVAYFRTLRKT
ncbi:hypothetical protein GW17_00001123 [Ensete ventricosum]|nr:hypothetical protein GW17_00001123 [Ensete ventricosum]